MDFINRDNCMNLCGIYKIKQKSTGLIYIGQTKMKFVKRYWHHQWKLNHGSHDNRYLQSAWNKYGKEDFEFMAILILNKEDDMDEYEINIIKRYNSFNNGFNLTPGGGGKKCAPMTDRAKKIVGEKNRLHNLGKRHSDETKERMRRSSPHRKLSEKNLRKLRESRLGSSHTDEAKQKMREAHIGSANAVSVINEAIALKIKEKLITGSRVVNISRDLNVSENIIRSILHQRVWNHVVVEGWQEFINKYNSTKKKCITDSKVREIRSQLKKGYTIQQVSEQCNVGYCVVAGIKQNRTYRYVD